MYNHDNDVVRVFQLITLVGKFNVVDLYINIASLHGADACCIDHCWFLSKIIKTINAFCGTLICHQGHVLLFYPVTDVV